jgi:hypothetical protein
MVAAVAAIQPHEAAAELLKRRQRRRAAIGSLAEFVKQAWPIIEPGKPLFWNWHLDIICDALERQARGEPEYRKLLICVPPGTMKSLLVSVFQPAWQWLLQPERRKLFLANDDDLAVRDSRRMRDIVTSDWYRELVAFHAKENDGEAWVLTHDQNEKVNFENTRHGFRQCRSITSAITGKRADDIVIDDPIDAKEVVNGSNDQVARRLQAVANVVDVVLPSRVNILAEARWTIIMQRLHESDVAGRAMAEGGWKVIHIQMEFEPGNPLNHPADPRTEPGALMFPDLFPATELAVLKVKLGRHWHSQYQQDPAPDDGTYILAVYFEDDTRYDEPPSAMNIYMASDYAVSEPKDGSRPDFTEHGVFGVAPGSHVYVLDWWYGQTASDEWVRQLIALFKRWKPYCYFGEAGVIQKAMEPSIKLEMDLHKAWTQTEWLPSMVDKAARGRPFQGMAAQKKIHFPRRAPWAERVIKSCVGFPLAWPDDPFDTMSLMCRAIAEAHPAIAKEPEKPRNRDRWADSAPSSDWKTA